MENKFSLWCFAVVMGSTSHIYAMEDTEIEQLRQEIDELRQWVQPQHLKTSSPSSSSMLFANRKVEKISPALGVSVAGAEIKLYGNIRADAGYQIQGGPNDRPYNQIANVALDGEQQYNDIFKSTLAATRLGLDFTTPVQNIKLNGKFEVDFLGSNDALRIRHAYLSFNPWLIGQTWSNFAPPDYIAETVDAMTYIGGSIKRTLQVRHSTHFNPKTNLVIALEDPKDSSSKMRLPALTARVNHQVLDVMQIGVRGMVNEKRTDGDTTTAWGVGVGTKIEISPSTMFKADYYHVKGDHGFVVGSNTGFTVDQDQNIVGENEFDSIIVGVTQNFNTQWRGTLGYGYMISHNDPMTYLAHAKGNVNKEMWQTWANVFYSPVQLVSFGVEYTVGERETFAKQSIAAKTGDDQRVNLIAMYNF